MKPDSSNIGQDKTFQDPADAQRQQEGVYNDRANSLPESDKLPLNQMPKGPDPQPFSSIRKVSGSR